MRTARLRPSDFGNANGHMRITKNQAREKLGLKFLQKLVR